MSTTIAPSTLEEVKTSSSSSSSSTSTSNSLELVNFELGVGLSDEDKEEFIIGLKTQENANDTWGWLSDLPADDYPLLMDLHKSTRKKFNEMCDFYRDPTDESGKKLIKLLRRRKITKRCLFWIVHFWANSANFKDWSIGTSTSSSSSSGLKRFKQLEGFKKNRRDGNGGQGIKKLQAKFWQRKYPNLFPQ